ncbi:hypothetical protein GCM10023212_10230 [Luteolibacter yonseiensis]
MALGIFSLILGPVTGIPAIVISHMAIARIRESGDSIKGRGRAENGLIMGYVFSIAIPVVLVASMKFNANLMRGYQISITQAHATSLESTVDAFVEEYGRMPANGATDTTFVSDKDTTVLETLMAYENILNPKEIRFLSFMEPEKSGITFSADRLSVKSLRDVWGGPFRIRLDLDEDGKIEVNGEVVDNRRVAVWSDGPDQKPGTSDDIKSW